MIHRRLLAVHDISCVGRCSLTVALPIISAVGVECSVLPTAVLSTHTGGFKGFTYRDLTSDIVPVQEHWSSLDLTFDAFYTGFLGSFEQIDIVKDMITKLSNKDTTVYVDPVMGDEGNLYTVFDSDFPKGMRRLCEMADVLMPNLTELCFMLGLEYKKGPYTREYLESVFREAEVFGLKKIVITGVSLEEGKVGVVYKDYETGETGQVMRDAVEGYYHGTGDVFGSSLVGALESGLSLRDSVRIAVEFTVGSIKRTHDSGADVRYGVDFEPGLKDYSMQVDVLKKGLSVDAVSRGMGIPRISALASRVWNEAYKGIVDQDQIDYMLEKYLSPKAIEEEIANGYVFILLTSGQRDVGFAAYRMEGERMFVSKLYVENGLRGIGITSRMLKLLKDQCVRKGVGSMYLTVNRNNLSAIQAYKAMGFVIEKEIDTPIGNGFEMNDYIMGYTIRDRYVHPHDQTGGRRPRLEGPRRDPGFWRHVHR